MLAESAIGNCNANSSILSVQASVSVICQLWIEEYSYFGKKTLLKGSINTSTVAVNIETNFEAKFDDLVDLTMPSYSE